MKTYRYCFRPKNVGYNVWVTKTRHVKKAGYRPTKQTSFFVDVLTSLLTALVKK